MASVELVIKIDEETYKDIKNGKVYSSIRDVPQESVLAIANGTPIPDNATNGDALCMLFPNMHYTLSDKSPRVVTTIGVASSFDIDWWNAPYKAEGSDKE